MTRRNEAMPPKAYRIQMKGEDEAEVDLYGEVVDTVPIDLWTGEKVQGQFIALDAFLKDLDTLKDKTAVTFRINSIGGNASAGVAIYNRIRELKGETTTIVDGLAASAASIIAQAGDRRVMNIGTQMMVHGASSFLFGYYNEGELADTRKMLLSVNKSVAGIYAERSGRDVESILSMMKSDKWMTPDEAVESGLADEVRGHDAPVAEKDEGNVIVNGVYHHLRGIPAPRMVFMHRGTVNKLNGGKVMDLKELKEKYPDLVSEIQSEALAKADKENASMADERVKEALSEDRARMKAIDEIASMVGDPAMVEKAKYDEPITAEQLALIAMRTQAKQAQEFSAARAAEVAPAQAVIATPASGTEQETDADIAADAKAAAKAFLAESKGGQKA